MHSHLRGRRTSVHSWYANHPFSNVQQLSVCRPRRPASILRRCYNNEQQLCGPLKKSYGSAEADLGLPGCHLNGRKLREAGHRTNAWLLLRPCHRPFVGM